MLNIRNDQEVALNLSMKEKFILEVIEHIEEIFPEKIPDMEEDAKRKLVEDGIEKADYYDITGEREVLLFIDMLIGTEGTIESLEDKDRLEAILTNDDLDQASKMDLVYASLMQEAGD